ncbi:MAG TPA: hypothetical protein VJ773_01950, partial [Gemmatimonadales bacterium]|nr:hypothetical protein [Gemmatimonadales bacterium]
PLPPAAPAASPPPFGVVAEHFWAALAWLGVGAVLLVRAAPHLARGNVLDPAVLAATHAFTLGVLTSTIFGALNQFFPGHLGIAARSIPVARWSGRALQAGTALLVSGFLWWVPALLAAGLALLVAAVYGSAWNLLPQRRKARQGRIVGLYVSAGHVALGTALVLASARIGETVGLWHVDRLAIIGGHLHLGVLGFGTLTAVGVGSRMLPMFLVSPGAPEWPLRWIGPAALAGIALHLLGLFLDVGVLARLGGALMATSVGLLLWLARAWFRRRVRRHLDPALELVRSAFVALAAALGLGLVLLAGGGGFRTWAAYGVLAIAGWLVPLVLGVMMKILAFLTWLNVAGPRLTRPGAGPTVQDLVSVPIGRAATTSFGVGLALLAGGILAGSVPLATAGAGTWALAALLTLVLHVRMVRSALATGPLPTSLPATA